MSFEPVPYSNTPSVVQPDMLFPEAADVWLESRTFRAAEPKLRQYRSSPRYIQGNTLVSYRGYVKSLSLFFSSHRLNEITMADLHKYQQARCLGQEPFIRRRRPQDELSQSCPTRPNHVNQELCILRAIMRRAGAWTAQLDEHYEELHEEPSEIPRALTVEEEQRWLEVSANSKRWWLVHWYSIVAFSTCMGTNEMRALRIGDISLQNRLLTVPLEGSKNQYRHRTIPLHGKRVLWAMENLLKRAASLGSVQQDHYLFPFCRGHIHYPDRPMSGSGLKKPWLEIKAAAKLPNFRMYDTRHTAITRLSEGGTPITVIMDMAGHISPQMTRHYTHVSDQAKIMAIERAQSLVRGSQAHFVPAAAEERPHALYENQAEMNADFMQWRTARAPAPPVVVPAPLQAPVIPINTAKPASPFSTFTTTIGHTFQRW